MDEHIQFAPKISSEELEKRRMAAWEELEKRRNEAERQERLAHMKVDVLREIVEVCKGYNVQLTVRGSCCGPSNGISVDVIEGDKAFELFEIDCITPTTTEADI